MKHSFILISILLFFTSCREDDFQTVTNFISTVEKGQQSDIKSKLAAIESKEIKEICELKIKQGLHKESKIGREYTKLSALIDSSSWIEAWNLSEVLLKKFKLHPIIHDMIQMKKLTAIGNLSTNFPEEFDKYEKQIDSPKNKYEVIRYVKFLLNKSKLLWNINQYSESLETAQFGRYLLSKNKLVNEFPITELDLLHSIHLIIAEDEVYRSDTHQMINKILREARINNDFELENLALVESILLSEYSMQDVIDSLIHLIIKTPNLKPQIYSTILSLNNSVNTTHNAAVYERQISQLKYDKARAVGYYQIGYAFLDMDNLSEAKRYYNKAKAVKATSPIENLWIKSYCTELIIDYYEKSYLVSNDITYIDSAIFNLTDRLKLNKQLFQDDTDNHLDDFSMELTIRLASLLEYKEDITDEEIKLFFYFLNHAQADEIKTKNKALALNNSRQISSQDSIEKLLENTKRKNGGWNNLITNLSSNNEQIYKLYQARRKENKSENPLLGIDIKAIQKKLSQENALIIGYLNSWEDLYKFTLDSDELNFEELDQSKVSDLTEQLNTQIQKKKISSDSNVEKLLFKDFADDYDLIYFIPDGELNKVPFNYLINDEQKSTTIYDINSILSFDRINIDKTEAAFFSFSNQESLRMIDPDRKHEKLPFSYEACKKITEELGVSEDQFHAGNAMTQKSIYENLHRNIVHLSTHGFSNDSIINENSILVRDHNNVEKMHTTDFDFLSNYPKFIYLDGCNTGTGINQIGEGSFSLSRIFIKNSVKSLVKTLWSVDDQSSAYFSTTFYSEWNKGISIIEAFHRAQQQTKAKYPEPYHWAPFVLEGNPNLYLSQN